MCQSAFFGFFAVFLVASSSAPGASADTVKFTIDGASGGRVLTLDSKKIDGGNGSFVSLQALVEQAGGAYNAISTRLRVDIESTTAWLRIGEPRVHALSIFTLRQAIKEDNGVAMIAVEDVPDFFIKSFRVNARLAPEGAAPTPTVPQPSTTMTTPGAAPAPKSAPESAKEPPALEQLTTPIVAPGVSAIFIDAAHGGYDTGLQSADKATEAAIVLGVATRVKKALEAAGRTNVILTRPDEKEVSAAQRAKFVRAEPGSIFVSLHLGSSLSPTAEGVAAYFPTPSTGTAPAGTAAALQPDARLSAESHRLAGNLGSALAQATGAPLRGILEIPLKGFGDFQSPSVELELGCLTSAADAQRLATNEYADKLAAGIVTGIMAYLDNNAGATSPAPPAPVPPAPVSAPKAN